MLLPFEIHEKWEKSFHTTIKFGFKHKQNAVLNILNFFSCTVCVCNSSKKYPLQSPCLLFTWHMQTNNLFSRLFLSRRLSLVLRIKDYPYQKLCCSSFPFIQCRFLSLFIQFVAIKLMLNLNLMSNFRSFIFILWNKNWIIKQKWSVENARCRLPGQFTHINMKAERYIT